VSVPEASVVVLNATVHGVAGVVAFMQLVLQPPLVLDRLSLSKERCRACVGLAAYALVPSAILAVAVVGLTRHGPSSDCVKVPFLLVV
jgi:hypothetical protein